MICIISGTNRPENLTLKIAQKYLNLLRTDGKDVKLLDFQSIPSSIWNDNQVMGSPNEWLDQMVDEYIKPASSLVFIMPEYNGSFPGVLKTFIDSVKPESFKNKKASLVGVASGRAGNLRGMDHLTHVLMHLGVSVMPGSLPISRVHTLLDPEGNLTDEATLKALSRHIEQTKKFTHG